MCQHTPKMTEQRCQTTNMLALPLWFLGIYFGVIFDNNQMAACLSDVQPKQIGSIRTDASVLLA